MARVCGAETEQGHGSADVLATGKTVAHGGADTGRRCWHGSRASKAAWWLGSGGIGAAA